MMVTFVSQCEKRALNKTRSVLDAFANRIGDKTWQTVITNEGLHAVKKLLRKTASKNTAVACHWLRSRSRSELVWIIGNRQKFDAQGIVPVNITQKTIVNTQWENDWHYLPLIECLTALAALFHDFGKASACFQEKLKPNSKNKFLGDPLRHEWVSVLLFNAFINGEADEQWLVRLAEGELNEAFLINFTAQNTQNPLTYLPSSAAASSIAWLVVSHHRLPLSEDKKWKDEKAETLPKLLNRISPAWGYATIRDDPASQKRLSQCLKFPCGLPSQSKRCLDQIIKWAAKMQSCMHLLNQSIEDDSLRLILYHSRLSLMLGDHHYSSQDADKKWKSDLKLIANTHRKDSDTYKKGDAKQKLDEHLVGVSRSARKIVNLLPKFESELPSAHDIKFLKKKSPPTFNWQDKAVDKIKEWKQRLPKASQNNLNGFFAVNMASTGCGKTIANPKVMRALSTDGNSLRFILALGLRTLTLQTGDEYRDRVGLDDSELAVLIGSKAVMDLHNENQQKGRKENEQLSVDGAAGSESLESLLDDDIDYACTIPEDPDDALTTILKQPRDRQFLYAPVLVCTIDYMIAATECTRGGRYILPSLRLMSSDLVIDEIDDFDGKDLVAIGRLIHLAGMLGRKVMISSATIPPDMAQGYFNAYREGWKLFAKTRDVSANIGCAWIDEFDTHVETLSNPEAKEARECYKAHHETFVEKRVKKLKNMPVKRKAEIISCHHIKVRNPQDNNSENKQTIQTAYFNIIQQAIIEKHHQHGCLDTISNKKISFGVVRVANIEPCIALTKYLAEINWPLDLDIRVMAYHSQQVLLLRSVQEKHLDTVMKRNKPKDQTHTCKEQNIIHQHINNSHAKNMIFILVATPVEEVGRDHDFDWAVIEPSSFRSIIQLSGRVLRHRNLEPKKPNIALMQYNLKALINTDDKPSYCRPGYERNDDNSQYMFKTHDLAQLIDVKLLLAGINALPRIQRTAEPNPRENLADLEHYSIKKLLTSYEMPGPEQMEGWLTQYWWLTALPQFFNTFRDNREQKKLYLMPQNGRFKFMEKDDEGGVVEATYNIQHQEMSDVALTKLWLHRNYQQLIEEYAEKKGIRLEDAALKYGEILLPSYGDATMRKYQYSSQLGLSKLVIK
jgi:CRISPR-associated endonuclease/helicase Cas3